MTRPRDQSIMLDPSFVREHRDIVARKLKSRGVNIDLTPFYGLDEERRVVIKQVEQWKHWSNVVSKQIGEARQRGEDAASAMEEMRQLKEKVKQQDERLKQIEKQMEQLLATIPNLPHDSVPEGQTAAQNLVVRERPGATVIDFKPLTHNVLGTKLGILDFERGAKITGSRFVLYKDAGAQLERALINFMIEVHTARGYTEVLPPFIANSDSFFATGSLPKFEDDLFKLQDSNYYLIPTAEVPVTNIYRDEVLSEANLPIQYVAYTPCFRREAGTYGQETRGLIRLHQFNKVELVHFSKPEQSYRLLENLTADAEEILIRLGLKYRVVALCTADLGFASAKTYDLEVWMPGQNAFVEISSCSNFEDFQARRANIRYKPVSGKGTRLVHTLNGSGLAIGRTIAAILENYQQKDGTVRIPDAILSYMNGRTSL